MSKIKVKNKTYQPIPLQIEDETIVVPKRKTVMVERVTQQMVALKAKGLLQIIK